LSASSSSSSHPLSPISPSLPPAPLPSSLSLNSIWEGVTSSEWVGATRPRRRERELPGGAGDVWGPDREALMSVARLRLTRPSKDGEGCAPPEELQALEAEMQASVVVHLRFQGRRRTRNGQRAAPHPTSALAQCYGATSSLKTTAMSSDTKRCRGQG
jgi:hypothetical protein